jgi:hypothetical protein
MRHPKISSPRAPFTTGIVSPDALCNTHSRLSFLSGCPTTMSGLAIFTDAIVPMVTRHGFSCIQPSAISPSSVTLSSTLSVKRGGESDHAGSLLLASSSGSSSHTASVRTPSRSDSQHRSTIAATLRYCRWRSATHSRNFLQPRWWPGCRFRRLQPQVLVQGPVVLKIFLPDTNGTCTLLNMVVSVILQGNNVIFNCVLDDTLQFSCRHVRLVCAFLIHTV